MLIELAGMPGTGKTSLAKYISDRLGITSVVLHPAPRRLLFAHPITAAGLYSRFWSGGTKSPACKEAVRNLIRRHIGLLALSPKIDLLLEEGLVHHVWRQLFLTEELLSKPWQLFMRRTHTLFVLDANDDIRHRRIVNKIRNGAPAGVINRVLAKDGPNGLAWKRGKWLFNSLVEQAGKHGRLEFIDTCCSLETAAERIYLAIRRINRQAFGLDGFPVSLDMSLREQVSPRETVPPAGALAEPEAAHAAANPAGIRQPSER